MATKIYDYMASLLVGKTYHFVCDCIIPLDVTGLVVDYTILNSSHEIVFSVNVSGKIIKIGSNHPNLTVTPV